MSWGALPGVPPPSFRVMVNAPLSDPSVAEASVAAILTLYALASSSAMVTVALSGVPTETPISVDCRVTSTVSSPSKVVPVSPLVSTVMTAVLDPELMVAVAPMLA